MKMEVCECLFLDNVQAQAEARTLGLLVVVLRNWISSPQLNGLITNQVVHRARILQYIHTSKQEIYAWNNKKVKEQCDK